MIRLGLRLTLAGGREAAVRLVLLVTAVGLGVGLLLIAMAGVNAVNTQNDRYAWLSTGYAPTAAGPAKTATDPLWWLIRADWFHGEIIGRIDVAATGPTSPVPPGISHLPGPGQYYASPAMAALLRSTPADQLAGRYPGHLIGIIGNAALPSPNSLVIVIGRTEAQLAPTPGAVRATAIASTPPSGCSQNQCLPGQGVKASGIDLILSVVALAILFPLLIFIGTATRLSAARREERFAAMRLAGATPRQISLIAAVESTVAAVAGVAAGFGLFFGLRIPLASVPFTGTPFFPSDLTLSLPDILLVAPGVPLAAAVVARLALRRVRISPLGVTRRVTPKAPRAWRVLPLLAGLGLLGFIVVHGHPPTTLEAIQEFLPAFFLVMAGLVTAGPWLTLAGARLMARRTGRPAVLIAARRLADNPKAGFRAVSGLVLALFITTVAVALITSQDTKSAQPLNGPAAGNVLADEFSNDPGPGTAPPPSAALVDRLRSVGGVQGVLAVHQAGGVVLPATLFGFSRRYGDIPGGLVSCGQLASIPVLGRCPAGAAVAVFPADGPFGGKPLESITWPASHVSASRLDRLPVSGLDVATSGTVLAVEQARTVLDNAYPGYDPPATLAEQRADVLQQDTAYQQLADVVVLISLIIAGCTLAASVAAGLAERKRPFSLLRLTGTPLGLLRHVVALESAVPLLVTAVIAIGLGFAAAAVYAATQIGPFAAPGAAYYIITGAGIALSLGIIAATMPLLRRITGPEVARNE
ncbi:MAG: ABC transporter permease [Actinomycetota bacterium]|nr:ABC transporter permease [Actinomycetota bacterium]